MAEDSGTTRKPRPRPPAAAKRADDPVIVESPTQQVPPTRVSPTTLPAARPARHVPKATVDLVPWFGWPIGGALIVWSLVAIARLNFEITDLYAATNVAGLGVSFLLAIIVATFGLLIWAAVAGLPNRRGVRTYGAVFIVFGIVMMIEPDSFTPYLGIGDGFGIVAAVLGAALMGVSLTQPFPVGSD